MQMWGAPEGDESRKGRRVPRRGGEGVSVIACGNGVSGDHPATQRILREDGDDPPRGFGACHCETVDGPGYEGVVGATCPEDHVADLIHHRSRGQMAVLTLVLKDPGDAVRIEERPHLLWVHVMGLTVIADNRIQEPRSTWHIV